MNREIKFRAWDEGNKIMHEGVEFIRSGTESNDWVLFKSDNQRLEDGDVLENPYFQQQIKLMQYTGLKDKNGKEIYEGDVVRWSGKVYLIEWHDKVAGFVMQNNGIERPDVEFESEVIGNIYENPELLNT